MGETLLERVVPAAPRSPFCQHRQIREHPGEDVLRTIHHASDLDRLLVLRVRFAQGVLNRADVDGQCKRLVLRQQTLLVPLPDQFTHRGRGSQGPAAGFFGMAAGLLNANQEILSERLAIRVALLKPFPVIVQQIADQSFGQGD